MIPWYYVASCNLSVCRRGGDLMFDESYVGWGCEDIDFAYRCWRVGIEFQCNPRAMVVHLDQNSLEDPYINRLRGKPANFTSVLINTVRMLDKFSEDPLLQIRLRETLIGFAVVGGECVSSPSGVKVDDLICWCRERIHEQAKAVPQP